MFRRIKALNYKEMYDMYNKIYQKEDMRRRKSLIKRPKINKVNEVEYVPYLAKHNQNKHVISSSLRNMLLKSPTRKNKNNYNTLLKNAIKLPYSKPKKTSKTSKL